jgi:nucleoid DNA-binding protein
MSHPSLNSWITVNSATGNESSLTPSVTTLGFNSQNSNMEQYLENHGAVNDIGFQLQLNPWGNVSGGWDEIFPQSKLEVNLLGNMPLNIGLTDLVLQDTFDFSFKQDFAKTHIAEGTLWLKATNAFPLQGEVTLYLMDAQGNTITAINSTQDVVSSVYGTVVNNILQKQSVVEFVIPDNVIDNLESVARLSVRVKMNTPNANTNVSEQVQIPAGAFFGFKVGAKLKVENRL